MFSKTNPKQRGLVIGLIIIGVLFSVFFGMRVFRSIKQLDGHGHRPPPPGKVETDVELIRGWMTIPFIAELYHVPEPIIFDAIKIPSEGNREKSIKELNKDFYPNDNAFLLETVKTTILAHQSPLTQTPNATLPATP